MHKACSLDTTDKQWRIRIGEVFDIEMARACLRHCREGENREGQPSRVVFDLTRTRIVHTAGLGVMHYIKGVFRVADGQAAIQFAHPDVGCILRLARMDRAFQLQDQRSANR